MRLLWMLLLSAATVPLLSSSACTLQQSPAPAGPQAGTFDEQTASRLLDRIRDGLEGRSSHTFLSAFDTRRMSNGAAFRAQINSFFRRYDSFRIHFNIQDVSMDGANGTVTADVELECNPRSDLDPPVRRHQQVQFTARKVGGGWRLVDLEPRSFFS